MDTWLDIVKMELEMLSPEGQTEPHNEVGLKDHVVGEAEPEVRKLYQLALRWERTAIESLVAARYINDRRRQEQDVERASMLRKKSEMLMDIFWTSLKDHYDLWGKSEIGIRKGWKVVWSEVEVPPIIDALRNFFGDI